MNEKQQGKAISPSYPITKYRAFMLKGFINGTVLMAVGTASGCLLFPFDTYDACKKHLELYYEEDLKTCEVVILPVLKYNNFI